MKSNRAPFCSRWSCINTACAAVVVAAETAVVAPRKEIDKCASNKATESLMLSPMKHTFPCFACRTLTFYAFWLGRVLAK